MYAKIAFNNVKKSFKEYGIYFLTLTLAVCIFYSFNAIDSQRAMVEMNSSQVEYFDVLNLLMSGISVFVSIILGSLMLYANNFLVKKRKKELGIYMILGMGKENVSKILFLETLFVGMISLVVGLIMGIIMSQGLSLLTAKLFEVGMAEYRFVLSIGAIGKTIFYFSIMFLLVMLFNTMIISRYRIIDLLYGAQKCEKMKISHSPYYFFAFSFRY